VAKKLGILLLFIALGSGAIAYTASNNESASFQNTDSSSHVSENPDTNNTSSTPTLGESRGMGSYQTYSETALSGTTDNKFLFFHAPWCPQCNAIESGIEQEGVPEGITIFKVDYDTNQALRAKYGVTLQTTFVRLDKNNNKVDAFVAYSDPSFAAVKNNYLLQ
jgi:thiol-disulfide isomerase/thioredoxin